jgi:xanthomonalisin
MPNTQQVTYRLRQHLARSLLPLAAAVTCAPAAHAATNWVATRTNAFLLPSTTTAQATSAATAYALNTTGTPALSSTVVTPLELSAPLHVTVVLKSRDDAALDAFLQAVNQPGNAEYHRYLTPAQFKARFAPTDAQVQTVVAHLKANGFSNIEVSENNKLITADGNANNVQNGFQASIKRFIYRGRSVYANDTAAFVPASLSGVVDAVLGLQNAEVPHRLIYRAAPNAAIEPAPAATNAAAGSQVGHQPTDFASIYDAAGLPAATNTTVGIITWGDMTQTIADLKQFTASAHLPTVNTAVVQGSAGTLADDGDPGEWDLDSQDIVGTSGGVKQLIFYAAVNGDSKDDGLTDATLNAAYNKAVTDDTAQIINVSLGEDESAANASGTLAADEAVFKQAAAQGQIFSVSAGDAGVYQWSTSPYGEPGYIGTDNGSSVRTTVNLSKYSVSWPAASQYVVSVGGTTLSTSNTTAWAGETVWNEGAAYADIGSNGYPLDNAARIWATGGGISLFEPAPSWQVAALGSGAAKREVPDVAFDAAQATGAYIVIDGQANQLVGGTSLASPIFVGGFARLESANNNALGLPTPNFYATLPGNPSLAHDITSGNNGYGGHGYTARAGWDNDTGFGSLDFAKLNASAAK